MNLYLIEPSIKYANSYRDALIEQKEESYHPEAIQKSIDDINSEIIRIKRLKEIGAHSPIPRQSYFWLIDGANYLGTAILRHRPTGRFPGMESHVYFEIRPSERGKGYGTQILALALIKARELGLAQVLVTADADNHASVAIIRLNGGKLIDQRLLEEGGRQLQFLRFSLPTTSTELASAA